MPNAEFAANLIGGFYDTTLKERDRKDRNAIEAAKFLMSTGRVKDMNELMPLLSTLGDPTQGKFKGGKKAQDPQQILQAFVNPSLKMGAQTAGGQQQPSFQQPAGGSGAKLFTEDEAQQRKMAELEQTGKIETATGSAQQKAKYEEQIRQAKDLRDKNPGLTMRESLDAVGLKIPAGTMKWTPGTVSGSTLPSGTKDIYDQPITPGKTYRQGTDQEGRPIFAPTDTPSSQQPKMLPGAAGQAVDEVLMRQGLDPQSTDHASPQYRAAVQEAARVLTAKRNLDTASRTALLNMRKWLLGEDLGPGGETTPAKEPPSGPAKTPPSAAPGAGAGGPAAGATGEAVLKNLPASEAAEVRQVAEYRKALPARYFNTPRGAKILGLVEQYTGQKFDQAVYNQRQRARIAFTSGKSGDNIRSLNQLTGHMAQAADAAEKLKNAPVHLWNRIANRGLEETGDPRVDAFLTPARAVATEMQNLLRGGVGDRKSIDDWQALLSQVKSPKQIQTVLGAMQKLSGSRLEGLETQWRAAMEDPNAPFDQFLTPESQKAMARLGIRVRQGTATASPSGETKVGDFTVRVKKPAA